jgi:hypothetical protein
VRGWRQNPTINVIQELERTKLFNQQLLLYVLSNKNNEIYSNNSHIYFRSNTKYPHNSVTNLRFNLTWITYVFLIIRRFHAGIRTILSHSLYDSICIAYKPIFVCLYYINIYDTQLHLTFSMCFYKYCILFHLKNRLQFYIRLIIITIMLWNFGTQASKLHLQLNFLFSCVQPKCS